MQSLDDLRRIIRRIETRRPPRAAAEPLERVVGGELVETGAGSLLVVRREYPLEHRHGRVPLDGVRRAPLDVLARVARVESEALAAERLLFLDTETTGLAREEDVPGALIPPLYFDWLRRRRAAPLARVFAHNRDDVLSLAALVGWFGAALGAAPALRAEEWAGLGRLWEPVDLERGLGY